MYTDTEFISIICIQWKTLESKLDNFQTHSTGFFSLSLEHSDFGIPLQWRGTLNNQVSVLLLETITVPS